jgi:hypothetical protein
MRASHVRQGVRWAAVAVHVVVIGALVAMTIPSFEYITRQLRSEYSPPDYWLYPILVLVTLALAASVTFALIRWIRGSRRALVGVDIAVFVASWTVLTLFAFSNAVPIVTWVLSPLAPFLAWRAPRDAAEKQTPAGG